MDRSSRDNQYVIRRNDNDPRFERRYEEYDTHNQPHTDNRLPSRQNYERNNQDSYYATQRPVDSYPTNDRRLRDSRYEDERERVNIPSNTRSRIAVDNDQEINRRNNPSDQTQRSSNVNYTVNPTKQTISGNPRSSLIIDVNIAINLGPGNRNPQVTTSTSNIRSKSPPIRSTAIIDDVGYIDLDIRSPERTARLATDGIIRSSPSK